MNQRITFLGSRTGRLLVGKQSQFLPFIVCGLAATFYLYDFVLQVSPSVMMNDLMRDFQLNAAGLGAMSAFYFYIYTPMQIPAGLLFDSYGPRLVITLAILACALGAFFFGCTNSVAWASVGRLFMGIGSAFAFIGSLILIARWFPPKHFTVLAGFLQVMSAVGAILGEAPLAKMTTIFGWRHTIIALAIIGFFLAVLVWLVVRDHPHGQSFCENKKTDTNTQENILDRLKCISSKSQSWWIALYSFISWTAVTVFAVLWGPSCIATLYNISIPAASAACSMIWIGIAFGCPFVGWLSNHIGRRCLLLTIAAMSGFISLMLLLYSPHASLALMYVLLFFLGVGSSGQSIVFGLVKDLNPPSMAGTAIGFNNMAVVAGGALLQPLVGILLDRSWTGEIIAGIPVYSAENYRWALFILPLCYLVGMIISSCCLKETHCPSEHDA